MKRLFAISLMTIMCVLLVGCGKNATDNSSANESQNEEAAIEGGTIGKDLFIVFNNAIASNQNLSEVVDVILADKIFNDIATGQMPVEEGYLNGFDGEISGFNEGIMFSPMIGTIPFVGYVFETDDVETLKSTLSEQARLDWNICTMADEMVVESVGNYVFFVMAPNSFE